MIDEIIKGGVLKIESFDSFTDALNAQARGLSIIDASFVLPGTDINLYQNFLNARLPGARFLDLSRVAKKDTELPNMLPDAACFSDVMRDLGVRKNDVIIVYGQGGMVMGPARLWWMLRGFGHKDVVLLDGGLPAWAAAGRNVISGEEGRYDEGDFTANAFDQGMIASLNDVLNASEEGDAIIFDARPFSRFSGRDKEPRTGMRSGHIPGSVNIPCSAVVQECGRLKSREEILKIFGLNEGTASPAEIIASCGSGITACMIALALFHTELNFKAVRVYDGSWSEWGREDRQTPVHTLSD